MANWLNACKKSPKHVEKTEGMSHGPGAYRTSLSSSNVASWQLKTSPDTSTVVGDRRTIKQEQLYWQPLRFLSSNLPIHYIINHSRKPGMLPKWSMKYSNVCQLNQRYGYARIPSTLPIPAGFRVFHPRETRTLSLCATRPSK